MANQKSGMDCPPKTYSLVVVSTQVPRLTAESTPITMLSDQTMHEATRASWKVAGTRLKTRLKAGWSQL